MSAFIFERAVAERAHIRRAEIHVAEFRIGETLRADFRDVCAERYLLQRRVVERLFGQCAAENGKVCARHELAPGESAFPEFFQRRGQFDGSQPRARESVRADLF